jgi:hypothetical protein|tara:strand:- start:349 stop:711 length:363 start_codon:yes stop_codon:yes gene_type:complete
MAKYCKIESGIVVNMIEADADFASEHSLVAAAENAEIGGTYDGSSFVRKVVTDDRTTEQKTADARDARNGSLKYCDWTVGADSPLSDSKKAEWRTYRQALRDIPSQSDFPDNITWPTMPE